MTTEQILGAIIILLVGLVIGGAGGQALVRRAIGGSAGQLDTATSAATSAAAAAATAAESLNRHVTRLQTSVDKQWDTLNEIQRQQMKLTTAFEQFPEKCALKHEAIAHDQSRMQAEIDGLRAKA